MSHEGWPVGPLLSVAKPIEILPDVWWGMESVDLRLVIHTKRRPITVWGQSVAELPIVAAPYLTRPLMPRDEKRALAMIDKVKQFISAARAEVVGNIESEASLLGDASLVMAGFASKGEVNLAEFTAVSGLEEGERIFVRTIAYYYVGRVVCTIRNDEGRIIGVVLTESAWIPSTEKRVSEIVNFGGEFGTMDAFVQDQFVYVNWDLCGEAMPFPWRRQINAPLLDVEKSLVSTWDGSTEPVDEPDEEEDEDENEGGDEVEEEEKPEPVVDEYGVKR